MLKRNKKMKLTYNCTCGKKYKLKKVKRGLFDFTNGTMIVGCVKCYKVLYSGPACDMQYNYHFWEVK